jgi:DNA transposition AAA+ family ATPase
MTFSDEIRREIERCGASRYRIAEASGVSQSSLSKFMAGGGLDYACLDRVAAAIGLHVTREHGAAEKLAAIPDKRTLTLAEGRTRKTKPKGR